MILNVLRGGNSYTANVWKQERFVLHANSLTGQLLVWTNLQGSANAPIAKYNVGSDNYVYIDMTDYVRAYPNVATIYVYDVSSVVSSVSVSVEGLINPAHVIIPQHTFSNAGARGYVIPPRMYYAGIQQGDVEAELYKTSGTWVVTGDATLSVNGRHVGQISGNFTLSNGAVTLAYCRRRMRCDVRYVLVKWVSFTGVSREHIFECTKAKQNTKDTFSLLQFDNAYSEIKGREDGFTLRLDNLDLYDMWYYADVLQSSSVQISFDGQMYYSAQVLDKSITLPDGEAGTNGILEIAINYKKYDAVIM